MIRCPQCSARAPRLAKFCGRCGSPLDGVKPEDEQPLAVSLPTGDAPTSPPLSSPSQAINTLVALDRGGSRASVPAASGSLLAGRYRIVRVLGRGGLGVVYRAWDEPGGRFVAAKILLPELMNDSAILKRFRSQVEPLAKLSHERIVPILDAGTTEDIAFLVMPLLPGGTLRKWIRARKPRRRTRDDLVQAVAWARQVAEGLAYAHRVTVHRDLKPENILMDGEGRACISDFDLAKFRRASPLTMTGASFGTAYYMAPEQIRDPGRVDPRADLFSLGVVLYETVTGALPVGAFRPPSRIVQGAPHELDAVVLRLLAFDPASRFPHAEALAAELGRVLGVLSRPGGGFESGGEDPRPDEPDFPSRFPDRFK